MSRMQQKRRAREFSDGLVGSAPVFFTVSLVIAVWCRFGPWPGNYHMLPCGKKDKKLPGTRARPEIPMSPPRSLTGYLFSPSHR